MFTAFKAELPIPLQRKRNAWIWGWGGGQHPNVSTTISMH